MQVSFSEFVHLLKAIRWKMSEHRPGSGYEIAYMSPVSGMVPAAAPKALAEQHSAGTKTAWQTSQGTFTCKNWPRYSRERALPSLPDRAVWPAGISHQSRREPLYPRRSLGLGQVRRRSRLHQ